MIEHKPSCTIFTGPDIDRFAMIAVATALELYAKHRIQVNRAYTPGEMLRAATHYTGLSFKRGEYLQAAAALRAQVKGIDFQVTS